jgi:hypothetical protein
MKIILKFYFDENGGCRLSRLSGAGEDERRFLLRVGADNVCNPSKKQIKIFGGKKKNV